MSNLKIATAFVLVSCIGIIHSCKKESKTIEEEADAPYSIDIGIFPPPNIASDNPLTREGVKLGRMLFYEKMLSRTNSLACANCHLQEFAFNDTARFSLGVDNLPGKRNAMSVFNMAWNSNDFFWDGRAHLLRHQSLKPIQDNLEMDETLVNVVSKLQASPIYPAQFEKAFGTCQIDTLLISKALEQFMNSIVSNGSKYDDYLAGTYILTAQEERGRYLFFTEYNPGFPSASGADCQHCHGGDNFENDKYMNNGIDDNSTVTDSGRQKVTGLAQDKACFKVPSLRNIALTAPYMHDGRFQTLEQVLDHYNLVKTSTTLDPSFQQQLPNGLLLSASDKQALVAFLKMLTDPKLIANPEYKSPF
jgi:cytochrome c peroxidase